MDNEKIEEFVWDEDALGLRGYPTNVTEDEFVKFSLDIGRMFGPLRLQKPMLICFIVYMILVVVLGIWEWRETGQISLMLIAVAVISFLCTLPPMIWLPMKIKRSAKRAYAENNDNRYYGEISIEGTELIKYGGFRGAGVNLNDARCMYIENTDYMAFSQRGKTNSVILLPARCLTEDMASDIRKAVFSKDAKLQRRVIHRMIARASEPIPLEKWRVVQRTLITLNATYTAEEYKTLLTDMYREQTLKRLPMTTVGGIALGTVLMMCVESVWAFVLTVPAFLLISIGMSTFRTSSLIKRLPQLREGGVTVQLTERGMKATVHPGEQDIYSLWSGIKRITESDTDVEFVLWSESWVRVPKRCIEDMDTLRDIVNTYRKPQ